MSDLATAATARASLKLSLEDLENAVRAKRLLAKLAAGCVEVRCEDQVGQITWVLEPGTDAHAALTKSVAELLIKLGLEA